MRALLTAVLTTILIPGAAVAELEPGLYDVANGTPICILANHRWYDTLSEDTGGRWRSGPQGSILYGDSFDGFFSQTYVLGPDDAGYTEFWDADFSVDVFNEVAFARAGVNCTPRPRRR